MAQLPLDLGHLPALGREDFMVAPSNEMAVKWLERWPGWGRPALAIYGPPGAGKTHLAHVFAARLGEAKMAACVIAPETLAVEVIPALLGEARAAIIDGAERAPETALLHLFNLVVERGGSLLLLSREPPARWGVKLADLRSRLNATPAVALEAPNDALLAAVLVKLFADRQLSVGEDVVAYLLRRIERNFAGARAAVDSLDRAALAEKRAITVALARRVLGEAAEPGLFGRD
jgi:chromosomal replication initiation ATPase DnaA